jgi:hypothetical protein
MLGATLLVIGFAWPYIAKVFPHIMNLPGNFAIRSKHFSFYFPLTLSIIISLILTAVLYIISKIGH